MELRKKKQVRMYCGSEDREQYTVSLAGTWQTLRVHSLDDITFLCEMTTWPPS